MNMSEILTRVDSLNDRSRLVMRSEPEETPVLTLVDTKRTGEVPITLRRKELKNGKLNPAR